MMATVPRSLRIPAPLWEQSVRQAREQGTTVTAIVTAALQAFTGPLDGGPIWDDSEWQQYRTSIATTTTTTQGEQ